MKRRNRSVSRPAAGLFFAGLIVALAVAPAPAATLTNADRTAYEIEIVEGSETTRTRIEPAAILKDLCPNGCVIRLNGEQDAEYVLDGSERVSIEDGLVYYDGALAPADGDDASTTDAK